MGSWGYGPLDSDSALDWLGNTMDEVELAIHRQLQAAEGSERFEHGEGDALRAAAQLLIVMSDHLSFTDSKNNNMLNRAADQLERLMNSQEWFDSFDWSDEDGPVQVKESIRLQIVALRDVVKEFPWMAL